MNSSSILSKNVALADVTVRRLVNEVLNMDSQFPSEPDEKPKECILWLDQMKEVLVFCDRAKEGFAYAIAVDLALVHKRWPLLPQEYRNKYHDDFFVYATRQTGKARGTIENHIRAVDTFFFKGIKPSGLIEVPIRDEDKKVILENGTPKTQAVEFDSFSVPLGKMILLRSKAEAGLMTKKDWQMLIDPGISWDHLNTALQTGGGSGNGDSVKGIVYRIEGPYLTATEYNQTVEIAEFNWEAYYADEDSFVHRAINRALLGLGISLDEKVIENKRIRKEVSDAYPEEPG